MFPKQNTVRTMEDAPVQSVDQQQPADLPRQQMADACVADWNAVHVAVGSFADEHSTL